jgi:membrane protein DedA with SNARE-associated domain
MTEILAQYIENMVVYAPIWGFLLVFFFMTIESSFVPFPSEVVMIPAGFLAWRGELTFQQPYFDLFLALLAGLAGSLAGAYINYFLAIKLGRPILYRYGKYFFLPEKTVKRAEEIFRDYGELATFVCRLLPAIRQLISIPAGLCRMNFLRFSFFTGLGAGIWCFILLIIGASFAHFTADLTYYDIVMQGVELIKRHSLLLFGSLAALISVYFFLQHKIMKD